MNRRDNHLRSCFSCPAHRDKKVVKLGVFFKVSPPYVFANNNEIFDSKTGHFDGEHESGNEATSTWTGKCAFG
jgi:hypothetical protein